MIIFGIIVSLIYVIQRATAAAAHDASTTRRNNDECLVWHVYNESSKAKLLQQKETVRTQRHIPCRVKHQGENEPYYEFGTVDLYNNSSICFLHRDPSLPINTQQGFQIAVKNEADCDHFWAPLSYDVDPLGPNIVRVGIQAPELESDIAICRYEQHDGQEVVGRMVMQGRFFGHCGYLSNDNDGKEVFVGGNFHALSAIPRVEEVVEHHDDDVDRRNHLVAEIQKRISLYVSQQDKRLIESISGHSVEELVDDLNNTDIVNYSVLARVLSTDRFIPHDVLNTKGLSLLRAVLAERMTLARRRYLGLDQHPDTVQWETDGVLLKDFDYYTNEHHQQEFDELLQMVAASKSVSAAKFRWVERNVTTVAGDPQLEPHIDTFHSVVKMWVYEKGVVTKDTGPLHFMRGSNRNTKGKLQWIYSVSLPPATEAIKEPSLRFRGDASDGSMTDILRPVLPLDCYNRTLVIADTSGIHHRGNAIPGTVRKTIRVSNGNDGGLPRVNPYLWDDWERPEAVYGEPECWEIAS